MTTLHEALMEHSEGARKTSWWRDIAHFEPLPYDHDLLRDWAKSFIYRAALINDTSVCGTDLDATVSEEGLQHILSKIPGRLASDMLYADSSTLVYIWDTGIVRVAINSRIDERVFVDLWAFGATEDRAVITEIRDAVTLHTVAVDELHKNKVFIIGRSGNSYEFYELGVAAVPLERGNYEEAVLAKYDYIAADLKSPTPGGRLAILDGPPGGGKTHMVRGLIDQTKAGIYVFVPPSMVELLTSPELIPMIITKKSQDGFEGPVIFVIEDADNVLVPRGTDNMSMISSLLNMTSGMVGSMLDIRAIATTNSKTAQIDKALLRPGRLSAQVTVGKLSSETAGLVYRRLTDSTHQDIKTEMTLAEVYHLAQQNGWEPAKDVIQVKANKFRNVVRARAR